MKNIKKAVPVLAITLGLAAGLQASDAMAADANSGLFEMNEVSSHGLLLAEDKCGKGTCGSDKEETKGDHKCGGDKCGKDKAKADHKCGGDKCGKDKAKGDHKCGSDKCGGDK